MILQNSDLPDNHVRAIVVDKYTNTWIGTDKGGLAKFDGTEWTVYDKSNSGLPDNHVQSIAIDKYGNKWIGTRLGLVKYDGTEWTVYTDENCGLPGIAVSSLGIDKNGNKWIGTHYNGVVVFNDQGIVEKQDIQYPVSKKNVIKVHQKHSVITVSYSLLTAGEVVLKVFDIKGRCLTSLVDEYKKAGNFNSELKISSFANGTYFIYLLTGSNGTVTKKIVLLR